MEKVEEEEKKEDVEVQEEAREEKVEVAGNEELPAGLGRLEPGQKCPSASLGGLFVWRR